MTIAQRVEPPDNGRPSTPRDEGDPLLIRPMHEGLHLFHRARLYDGIYELGHLLVAQTDQVYVRGPHRREQSRPIVGPNLPMNHHPGKGLNVTFRETDRGRR